LLHTYSVNFIMAITKLQASNRSSTRYSIGQSNSLDCTRTNAKMLSGIGNPRTTASFAAWPATLLENLQNDTSQHPGLEEVRSDHQFDRQGRIRSTVSRLGQSRVCNKQTIQSDVVRLNCLVQSERRIGLFEVNCSDCLNCLNCLNWYREP
jgi:hypothetical protein